MIGRQPDAVIACVGGGSNAMGIFYPYIDHAGTRLIGVEAAGEGISTGRHAASISAGSPGVLHGNRTYLLQDENGQIIETHSISAGLDYPGVGPEHAYLNDIGRAEYVSITDDEALAAFHRLCRSEGIIPALESSHAVAHAMKLAPTLRQGQAPARQPVRPRRQGHRDRRRARRQGAPMSRIAATFAALAERGRKALIPYVTAGDPHADTTPQIMQAMVEAGADVIELGVPFSDPMADGPVIQKASERALARGIGLANVLAMVRDFRGRDRETPVVLMGYANPIERYGVERFVADAAGRAVSTVSWSSTTRPRSASTSHASCARREIDPIFLIAPTSSDARIASVAEAAGGYVYHVSLKGVTGAGHFDIDAVKEHDSANQGAREAAGRRRLRHPRRGDGARGGRRRRCGRHRQRAGPAARRHRARRGAPGCRPLHRRHPRCARRMTGTVEATPRRREKSTRGTQR